MWSRRNTTDTELPESEVEIPEIYRRVEYVLDGLANMLPKGMQKNAQYGIVFELMRGLKRDISVIPEDEVKEFMGNVGEACLWIANGSMSDLEDSQGDDISLEELEHA